MKNIICEHCNNFYEPTDIRQKFCFPCKKEKKRLSEIERKAKIRASKGMKIVGNLYKCSTCEEKIIFSGGRNKYCNDCKKKSRKLIYKNYRKNNPDYQKNYLRKNPTKLLSRRISWMVWDGLKNNKNGISWQSRLNFSVNDLKIHIEKQFLPGTSWDNMSEWHIDHIIPVSSFNFKGYDDEDFKFCWSLNNLRPLWKEENLKKSNKRTLLI